MFSGIIENSLAWLSARSETVENTFTYGDINITLEEQDTNLDADDDPNTNLYEMSAGAVIEKDPRISVLAGSEACYLFVKMEESGGNLHLDGVDYSFRDFLEYSMADGWLPLSDAGGEPIPGIYYREVEGSTADVEFPVLLADCIRVKDSVSQEMLRGLADQEALHAEWPMLCITAYAVQRDHVDSALQAWNLAGE